LGNAEITFPLGIALGLGLLMRRHVREALTLFALPASQVLELVYKYVIVDPPPGAELHRAMGLVPSSLTGLDVRTNGSFPSGHALRATILYGLMVWLGARFGAGRSRWLVLIPAALAVLIPVSRVYVADHWLSDVLGALALGWALNLACMAMVMASDG
jgi:undecaprenyl-diphosphatase